MYSPRIRRAKVAPLRGRGLKHEPGRGELDPADGRSLTGAWIETIPGGGIPRIGGGRSLTGAWIETDSVEGYCIPGCVAPLRGRGLKLVTIGPLFSTVMSLPYGGVD